MPRKATTAAGNIYCQARYQAAETNEHLSSREGAAELLFCGRDVVAKIELDIVRPGPELVAMMADLYGAPELLSHYCARECAIGRSRHMAAIEDKPVAQTTCGILRILGDATRKATRLIEIAEDGVIDPSERSDIRDIIRTLAEIGQLGEALKLQAERNKRAT